MAIQDHDLKTDDRSGLDKTPFRVLLRKDVDLLRDARILEVGEDDDRIVLALQDKNPDTPGRIKLFLQETATLELKEWITTDAQGLDTRVELTEFDKAEDLDAKPLRAPADRLAEAAAVAVARCPARVCISGNRRLNIEEN